LIKPEQSIPLKSFPPIRYGVAHHLDIYSKRVLFFRASTSISSKREKRKAAGMYCSISDGVEDERLTMVVIVLGHIVESFVCLNEVAAAGCIITVT